MENKNGKAGFAHKKKFFEFINIISNFRMVPTRLNDYTTDYYQSTRLGLCLASKYNFPIR